MSFSKEVKEELYRHINPARHCELAELSALIDYGSKTGQMLIQTDNEIVARKCFTLFEKTFKISGYRMSEKMGQGKLEYYCPLSDEDSEKIRTSLNNELLLERICCKRAYLRGAFISAGSVSDPERSYHLEIVTKDQNKAERLIELFETFDIQARLVERKGSLVVYIKDGEKVAEALNVMEAPIAMMQYENVRILRDVNNKVNRTVNCEAANIKKTVNAYVKQKEAIEYVQKLPEYKLLPESVKTLARLRLEYPDASLKELGELCDPKVGKSGVNHRLRRIIELADKNKSKC
ncbi:MAG: DNA-binding protein WhiA [Lachnospiraceae bacterium]|nr:DNA-binding protein WhiA [Lachnospiraceae bacterium]